MEDVALHADHGRGQKKKRGVKCTCEASQIVIADEIDRAIAQYMSARNSDAYEPYLDGYGFYKTAESLMIDNAEAIAADVLNGTLTFSGLDGTWDGSLRSVPKSLRGGSVPAGT